MKIKCRNSDWFKYNFPKKLVPGLPMTHGLIKSISKDSVSSTIKKLTRNVCRVFDYLRMTNNSKKVIG